MTVDPRVDGYIGPGAALCPAEVPHCGAMLGIVLAAAPEPAYHHDFWLAIAAAAPIIALTLVPIYGRADQWTEELWHRSHNKSDAALSMVPTALCLAGIGVDALCFGAAVQCLADERDTWSVGWAGVLTFATVLLVVLVTWMRGAVRRRIRHHRGTTVPEAP